VALGTKAYRSSAQTRAVIVAGAVAVAAGVAGLVATTLLHGPAPTSWILVLWLMAGGALVLWRCLPSGAYLERHRVVIRNPLTTYAVAWTELERFEIGAHGVGRALLLDGRELPIWAIAVSRSEHGLDHSDAQAQVDELNAALEQWRSLAHIEDAPPRRARARRRSRGRGRRRVR